MLVQLPADLALQFGEFADGFGDEVQFAEAGGAADGFDIGADDGGEFGGQRFDA